MGEFQLWTFLPSVADYVGTLGESARRLLLRRRVVDVLVHRHATARSTPSASCSSASTACSRSTTRSPTQARAQPARRTWLAARRRSRAVRARARRRDARARRPRRPARARASASSGTLQDWVDLELIARARAPSSGLERSRWSASMLVDIGAARAASERAPARRATLRELPGYCKGFDVGIIPYRIDERMTFRQPAQAARVPVGGSAGRVDCFARGAPATNVGAQWPPTPDGFVGAIEAALAGRLARAPPGALTLDGERELAGAGG